MHRRIVIAPDSFKGTCTAAEVAAAIARGWQRSRPDDELVELPMADGGEGTIDALATDRHGDVVSITVRGPLDEPVEARVLRLPPDVWVVELAETSGLTFVGEVSPKSAAHAHTYGLGQAIRYAIEHGARQVLVGLGSSASTDAGAGALLALGATLTDDAGEPIPLGNHGLERLAHVDLSTCIPLPPDGIVALTDVSNPLCGPNGAAAVFGPQKGMADDDRPAFDRRLAHTAALFGAGAGAGVGNADPDLPGAGAAGGTGFGLLAIGARIAPGADAVAEAAGLGDAVGGADLVITGEGSFDAQSLAGKVPSRVLAEARDAGVPAMIIAGRVDADAIGALRGEGRSGAGVIAGWWSLSALAGGDAEAMRDAAAWLERAGTAAAAAFGG